MILLYTLIRPMIHSCSISSVRQDRFYQIAGPLRDTKPHSKKKTTFVNMSNEHITNDELELLSLGLKFTPTPMNDPSTDIASRIQPTIRNLANGVQSSIANDISHLLLHPPQKRDNLQPHQRRALKNLKTKKQRLRILPADKGNATVLLSHEQYHSKMSEHISSGPYTLLQRDPTSSLPGKVDRILKKLLKEGKIDISVFNSCRNLYPSPLQLYGLPKIHKPNTPIRPIVSFYNTSLIALHKTLAHYIQPLTHSHLRIRDSKHMIHILHDNPHPTHSYYCSFDIKSLYTSCSMKLAQRTVIEQFTRDPSLLPAHFSITALDTLISFCLDHSYFEYNGSFYSQTEGGPMGSPFTVALAEVRITNVESLALAFSADPPSLYKHFVDNGISRYRDRQHAESFLEHLNSLSDDLVYTIEHPALDGTLPFLDILLHPDFSTSVYRKPTHTDSYTHYSTSSPQSTRDSLISSLTRRAYDICSPQHLPHELEHIRTVLLDNGYPLSRIELVIRRTKQSIDHPASAPIKSDKQSAKVFIPYCPHVNKQISSILQRHSVSSACTSNKNLRDLLSSFKSRQPALQTSNIRDQIPCKDCSATYCGQTSRPLHKRISEHERYTRPAYSHATDLQQSSASAQHAHASGHQVDFSSAVILAKLQHQQQLDLVEHAAITNLEPPLNRNHAAPSINPQWHPILQSISEQFHPISIT